MNAIIGRIITSDTGLDTLPIRLSAGVIFTAHGAQKLFGWFDGYGLEGTAGWMTSIGLEPGLLMATIAGGVEFFGGLLLVLGLLVRPVALLLAITMVVAIISAHLQNGLFMSNNGYEFSLSLLAISASLVFRGPGNLSMDQLLKAELTK